MPAVRYQNNFDISAVITRRAYSSEYAAIREIVVGAKLPSDFVDMTPFIVAVYEGEIVGVIGWSIAADTPGGWVHIRSLSVKPEFRKRGIGNTLIRALREYAQRHAHNKLLVAMSMYWNNRFYKNAGFTRIPASAKQHDMVARLPEHRHCTCWGMKIRPGDDAELDSYLSELAQ